MKVPRSTLFVGPAHKQLLKPDKPDKPLPPRVEEETVFLFPRGGKRPIRLVWLVALGPLPSKAPQGQLPSLAVGTGQGRPLEPSSWPFWQAARRKAVPKPKASGKASDTRACYQ
jgi:hypothetical protein